MRQVDAAVIGFGKGGKTLASALAAAGKTVALVEKSPKMYGGTCINVACIPTKSLVHSAALSAAQGGTFDERAARYAAAIDEKDRVTGLLRGKNYHKLADLPNVEVVDGSASFADATHLTVAKPDGTRETIEAAQAFINTGAHPRRRRTARARERDAARRAHAARAPGHHRRRLHRHGVRLYVR